MNFFAHGVPITHKPTGYQNGQVVKTTSSSAHAGAGAYAVSNKIIRSIVGVKRPLVVLTPTHAIRIRVHSIATQMVIVSKSIGLIMRPPDLKR